MIRSDAVRLLTISVIEAGQDLTSPLHEYQDETGAKFILSRLALLTATSFAASWFLSRFGSALLQRYVRDSKNAGGSSGAGRLDRRHSLCI